MLVLSNISKVYGEGENAVHALKGVNITFREKELVSILGQSGCGKTTLLNIIGGLDKASDGDLILNNVSTKNYTDADWDDYRNASVGFVFQNYNLISHLDILHNVELALTVSGISGEEKTQRAKAALDAVGLKDLYHKLPNQISGGQAQRVAIARAIVNDPEFLLADEPTGAIDSETSIQIMNLLKEISEKRLVIMVTHNSELAEQYSTRIIRILDGQIISDSDPYMGGDSEMKKFKSENMDPSGSMPSVTQYYMDQIRHYASLAEEERPDDKGTALAESKVGAKGGKKKRVTAKKGANMSFFAALKLSWKNLISKRGRSVLTAIAGSIGIICIALILAVNNGFGEYITEFEKNSLSRYPITITTGEDTMLNVFERMKNELMGSDSGDSFDPFGVLINDRSDSVYEKFSKEEIVHIYELFTGMMNSYTNEKSRSMSAFKEYVESDKFDKKWGSVKYDYAIDLSVFAKNGDSYIRVNPLSMNGNMKGIVDVILAGSGMSGMAGMIYDFLDTFEFMDELVADSSSILADYDVLKGHLPQNMNEIALVIDEYNQLSDFDAFALNELDLVDMWKLMSPALAGSQLDSNTLSQYDQAFDEIMTHEYYVLPTSAQYKKIADKKYKDVTTDKDLLTETIENESIKLHISCILRPKPEVTDGCIKGVIGYPSSLSEYILEDANTCDFVTENTQSYNEYNEVMNSQEVLDLFAKINDLPGVNFEDTNFDDMMELLGLYSKLSKELTTEEMDLLKKVVEVRLVDFLTGKSFTPEEYQSQMKACNVRDLDEPSFIYIYPNSVANKNNITAFINSFNSERIAEETTLEKELGPDEEGNPQKLSYTDIVEFSDDLDAIVHDMDSMVDTITYILIAVALVSVLVTMLLIAIVMYISVQDRTREIGILRAIGARKTDISNIFNAETTMLGLVSGVLGSALAFAFQYPANAIFAATLGLSVAKMAWWHPIVLIIGSMLLTLIAGLIPAIIAAKKEPVIALRTE